MKTPLRIAVADDEPVMQMYLEETLNSFGHEVVVAAQDGVELVESFRRLEPDLIVTDIKMPRMDGIEATRAIYDMKAVPVVFITGYNDMPRLSATGQHFILVYLVKPVGEKELRQGLDAAVRLYEEFETLRAECEDEQHALNERLRVEEAKTALSVREGMSQAEAFDRLRERARDCGVRITDAARLVLELPRGGC